MFRIIQLWEPGIAQSIQWLSCEMDKREIGVGFPGRTRVYFVSTLYSLLNTVCTVYSILYVQSTQSFMQVAMGVILLESKRSGRKSDHIPSYNAVFNTDRNYTTAACVPSWRIHVEIWLWTLAALNRSTQQMVIVSKRNAASVKQHLRPQAKGLPEETKAIITVTWNTKAVTSEINVSSTSPPG
jgi:hypothetical protein